MKLFSNQILIIKKVIKPSEIHRHVDAHDDVHGHDGGVRDHGARGLLLLQEEIHLQDYLN